VVGADEAGHSLALAERQFRHRASLHEDEAAQHDRQAARDRSPAAAAAHRLSKMRRITRFCRPSWRISNARWPDCDAVILSDYGKGGLTHITK
jgi:bifunctional ADP-heptose synthase (sugar kinase/adenylyltransferase)